MTSDRPGADADLDADLGAGLKMETGAGFYIVRCADDRCEVVAIARLGELPDPHPTGDRWGPYQTVAEAIAKRVGLIRSGKCKPTLPSPPMPPITD